MPRTNLRVVLVVDGNNLKFELNKLRLGKIGAEPVRQPLVDMIATKYWSDRRFVHVRIVVDVDALVEEGRFWGEEFLGKARINDFFEELKTHPTITICKGRVENRRALIEGIGTYYASNPTVGRVVLGLGKGGHDPSLIEDVSKACHEHCAVEAIQPWSFHKFLVDPLERQETTYGSGHGSLYLSQEEPRHLNGGEGLRHTASVQFHGPVPSVPGNAGDQIEHYSPAAVEDWGVTFLDPVITTQFPDMVPSREDFEEIRHLCFDYYHKGCSQGENCDKLHKYGKHGEKFLWVVRHLPCPEIDKVCGEADHCLLGHHCPEAILGRCNRTQCRFKDWHHPAPCMTGTILDNGELQPGRLRVPLSREDAISEFWDGSWGGSASEDESTDATDWYVMN